jgi:hypothetical protein
MSLNAQPERPSVRTAPAPASTATSTSALLVLLIAAACAIPPRAFGKLETWKQETASAFTKGHRERVVVSENGRVRLGQVLGPVGTIDATRVWDLARTADGTVYAATGDAGKVFRRDAKPDAPWTVAYDSTDTQALALAALPDGRVFVGTGPSGQLVEISDPQHPVTAPRLADDVKYIWDLAADSQGNLYAATGPTGQLWKVARDGKTSLLFDSKHSHLLCVAVAADGAIYAGSDGEGLVYRVQPDGKASVLYDAPQQEVRSLLIAPDGSLYAGTAAESGGSGSAGRNSSLFGGGGTLGTNPPSSGPRSTADSSSTSTPAAPEPPPKPSQPSGRSNTRPGGNSPTGGSASPRPPSAGDNAVYRIGPDSVPREIFRARVLVYALAWQGDRLLIGTGPDGQLYEVRDQDHVSAPIARLDHGQILSLLAEPTGALLIGAGDPGAVVRLEAGHVASGTLVSDVHDTKLISRFGALTWRADVPPKTSVAVQVRTGNVAEPDETWSPWSAEQTDPATARAQSPPGRFAQYRVTLSTRDTAATPELRAVYLRYQTANLPPEINRLDVPDVTLADGATRPSRVPVRWDVDDPNGDDMSYTLHIRKEGWPDWVRLGDERLTGTNFDWDTTAVPAGLYRIRLTATDRPSNNPDDALTRDRTSDPFVVDHEAPRVAITPKAQGASIVLKDNLTRLVKAAYAVDGGEWVAVFPDDTLFDSPTETITVTLPDVKPGTHILVVRSTDSAGNTGTADALIEVR